MSLIRWELEWFQIVSIPIQYARCNGNIKQPSIKSKRKKKNAIIKRKKLCGFVREDKLKEFCDVLVFGFAVKKNVHKEGGQTKLFQLRNLILGEDFKLCCVSFSRIFSCDFGLLRFLNVSCCLKFSSVLRKEREPSLLFCFCFSAV